MKLFYSSRLGCQIEMNKDLDGITVRIPSATRNLRVDGKIAKFSMNLNVIFIPSSLGSKPTHH